MTGRTLPLVVVLVVGELAVAAACVLVGILIGAAFL